jgi:hypothetical protein
MLTLLIDVLVWNRFELWGFYDKQFGKISEIDPSKYGLFTASNLKK